MFFAFVSRFPRYTRYKLKYLTLNKKRQGNQTQI